MAKLITVYRALPDEVTSIVRCLEDRHLHPVVVDNADKMGVYRSHEIRVAVPATERDMARGVLAEAGRQQAAKLSDVVRQTDAVVLILILVLGVMAVIGFLDTGGKWSLLAWVGLTAAVAVALARWAWRKKPSR